MGRIPRDDAFDSALALLREGNTFITNRCNTLGSDIFETRLLGKKTYCIMGEEAAATFYRQGGLTRRGAIPPTVLRLLQDKGSVATLDDKEHLWRKQLFMSLLTHSTLKQFLAIAERHWHAQFVHWQGQPFIRFFNDVETTLCKAVCEWSGITLDANKAEHVTRDITAMIDGSGTIGWRNLRGILRRWRCEHWISGLIEQVRSGLVSPPSHSALYVIAWHKQENEKLLDLPVATVELLNILRPTVAVARYILFAAIALHRFPETKNKIRQDPDNYLGWFVHEVRRFFPFFPYVGGIVRKPFQWRGENFSPGVRIMLDIYGTNHDPRIWDEPFSFRPERFEHWSLNPHSLIPQGGGDYIFGHRCAGEQLTLEIMKQAVLLLATIIDYDVLPQDYDINMRRMPALPHKPFIINQVRYRLRECPGRSG